jgi:glycogen synthase
MTKEYPPVILGGLGTVAAQLTRALIRSNAKINVITQSVSRSVRYRKRGGIALLRIPAIKPYYKGLTYQPQLIQQTAARYFSGKPDVIHVHSLEFAAVALWYKRQTRIPVVYTCHSLVSGRKKESRRKKTQTLLMRHADRIAVPSDWLKRTIRRQYPAARSKLSVIPHGVKSVSNRSKAAPHRLLFVGRLIKNKGIEPLIRSISLLTARNKQVRLTVIGKGSPRYQRRLRAVARKHGVSSKIRWLGYLPHGTVQRLYSSYGAVVVPSRKETFCMVALEAMANGIPLVSTRSGGLKEFVNGRNAQIIRTVSSHGISRAIAAMWQDPVRTRQRTAMAKRVAKRYSWRQRALQYKTLLKRCKNSTVVPCKE